MSRLAGIVPYLLLFAMVYPRVQSAQDEVSTPVAVAIKSSGEEVDQLPHGDVVTFLEKCTERYRREVKSYTTTLKKHERIAGALKTEEIVEAEYNEEPFSVCMKWLQGDLLAPRAVLYVKGQNEGNMLVNTGFWTQKMAIDSALAKSSGRYRINQFGINQGTERVLDTWRKRKAENRLHVEYLGIFKVPECDNRPCYKIHRSKFEHPEDDGVLDVVLFVDTETWLQTSSTLRGENGKLIASYYFSKIKLNPVFPPDHFNAQLLKK